MPQEIERKFLVNSLPSKLRRYKHDDIRQGYLAWDKTEIRLRRRGKEYLLTVKRDGDSNQSRQETEVPIPQKSFAALWPLTAGMRIKKRRYQIPTGRLTIELDIYRGKLKGLAIAEVEFPTTAASARFKPPAWFGKEVTGLAKYTNQALAARTKRPPRKRPKKAPKNPEPESQEQN